MSRTVFCKKYQQTLEGLELPPLPGAKGQEIFSTVSKKAWEEWLNLQTMLINEKQLNTMNMTDRTYLNEQMNILRKANDNLSIKDKIVAISNIDREKVKISLTCLSDAGNHDSLAIEPSAGRSCDGRFGNHCRVSVVLRFG